MGTSALLLGHFARTPPGRLHGFADMSQLFSCLCKNSKGEEAFIHEGVMFFQQGARQAERMDCR
jgi:hypothetical protein